MHQPCRRGEGRCAERVMQAYPAWVTVKAGRSNSVRWRAPSRHCANSLVFQARLCDVTARLAKPAAEPTGRIAEPAVMPHYRRQAPAQSRASCHQHAVCSCHASELPDTSERRESLGAE